MRRFLVISCVVLAGCSAPASNYSTSSNAADQSSTTSPPSAVTVPQRAATDQPGGIRVTAAPGVAFNYHYAFRVPNAKIANLQEEHAQMCEKLGIARCRITGMKYQLVNNDQIDATLDFKLDPTLARQFGKDGIAAVNKVEGMLVDAEISGTDAGAVIESANHDAAQARDGLAATDEKLKRVGLSSGERVNLEDQARELRQQLNGAANTRNDAQKSLATTPMEFVYGSGNLIPGFDGRSPLRDALSTAETSFATMVSFVLVTVALLGPWIVLGGLGYWGYRKIRERLYRQPSATEND